MNTKNINLGDNMSEEKNVLTLTSTDLENYKAELQELLTNRRMEIAMKIKKARSLNVSLADNPEYDAAKAEQKEIEDRIAIVKKILHNEDPNALKGV